MFKRIFRRRRPASASSLRRALHGTAVSLSSAAFGYGTTFIPGVDAAAAAGLGLGALPVVLVFFPMPPRDGSHAAAEHGATGSDAHRPELEQPGDEGDLAPSGPSPRADAAQHAADTAQHVADAADSARDAADAAGSTHDAVGTVGAGGTPPDGPERRRPDEDVMVWEPHFEIKPRFTVHPATFEQAPPATAATPPADPGQPRTETGKAS
ncbi:hypothetical protein ABT090_36970 [Streptomyces asoensis]|uniref:hypothetical protein n=1 Tax=Streptomyces asoensis TaxID=249586 RepID=UPI00332FF441